MPHSQTLVFPFTFPFIFASMSMLNYIIWNTMPEIVSGYSVRWYGLLFAAGFVVSQQILFYIHRQEGKPEKDIETLTIYIIVATIIGARLGHVLFYEPNIILEDPLSVFLPFKIYPEFKFTGLQGLASHGGAAAILFAIWLYTRYDIKLKKFKFSATKIKREGQNYLQVLDRLVIVVALTGCFIRFGNFMNSEIVGLPTRTDHGVVFARNVTETLTGGRSPIDDVSYTKDATREPVDGYQPITLALTFKNLGYEEADIERYLNGSLKNTLTGSKYAIDNIFVPSNQPLDYTLTKRRDLFVAKVNIYGIARHPAQLYESISCFLIFVFLFVLWNRKKNDLRTGSIFGLFLVILFGLRFFYEFLKENQVPFEDDIPLNMGQWLSIPLVAAGIFVLINAYRTKKQSTG